MASSAQIGAYYTQQYSQVQRVATTYGISPETLWGIYGTESGYGTNLGPSSKGALGPFQFLPTTGATYGLNGKTIMDFGPSLTAAAKYLKSLGANANPQSSQTLAALNQYSGGGGATYQSKVIANGTTSPKNVLGNILGPSTAAGTVGNALTSGIEAPFKAVSDVSSAITWAFSNWLRILEFVGGVILVVFGLVLLGRTATRVT